jgi:hypothetical protein
MFGSADDVIWWAVGGQMESFAVRLQTADPHEGSILRLLCIEVIQLLFLPSSLSLFFCLFQNLILLLYYLTLIRIQIPVLSIYTTAKVKYWWRARRCEMPVTCAYCGSRTRQVTMICRLFETIVRHVAIGGISELNSRKIEHFSFQKYLPLDIF